MEELGGSKTSKPEVLSKSSEELDQLQRKQAVSGKDKRTVSFLAKETHTEKTMFSYEEHANNSQAAPEKKHLTGSVKYVYPHEDKIHMAPHSNGFKNRNDTDMPVRSTEADEITLETGRYIPIHFCICIYIAQACCLVHTTHFPVFWFRCAYYS